MIKDFQPTLWRGSRKYFNITAIPVEHDFVESKHWIENITFMYDMENYTMKSKESDYKMTQMYMLQFYEKPIHVQLNNLHHYANYSVNIQACNEKGCGEVSTVFLKTDEYIPTCNPSNIVLQNTSTTSLELTWSNLTKECSHGIIRGYNVTMRRTRTGERIKKSVPTAMTVVFDNLEKYELVCVTIGGYTSKGLGKVSGEVCAHTAEDGELNRIHFYYSVVMVTTFHK